MKTCLNKSREEKFSTNDLLVMTTILYLYGRKQYDKTFERIVKSIKSGEFGQMMSICVFI